jgi:hypothetical protein
VTGILGGDPTMFAAMFAGISATITLVGVILAAAFRGDQ